jgi:hypothetical protein
MAHFHSPRIVTDGLVLALDAGNTKSYPGSGTIWFDKSGNGNNGTLTNGPTFSSANLGSIVFDGVNDGVNIPNSPNSQFPHNSPWTISMYGKIISQNLDYPGFLRKGDSTGSGVLFFYISTNFYIKHNNNQVAVSVSTSNPFNIVWSHNGSGTTFIYLNGNYISTGPTMASNNTSDDLLLGTGDQYGNVSIYSLSKYNRAITASEIQQNFNATKGRFGL